MKGSVTKRCGCAPTYSAKGDRLACKLKHGSWSYVADGGKDPKTGKRRQIKLGGFATKTEAESALAALVDQAAKGILPARKKETFKTFAEQWIETRSRKVRADTATGYKSALNHAYAAFGSTPLGEVTRRDVERMTHKLTDAGRSQRHLSFVLFVVRSVFEDALHDGLIARNPAARVDAVGRPPKGREALSSADMVRLRAHVAFDRLYACWLLTLYGLRRSEVMGVKWSDVDLTAGTLAITVGVVADSSGRRSDPTDTKTRRGTRTLPLPADVLTALRKLRESQAAEFGFEHVRTGYLAVDELGEPYRPERWSDLWTKLCSAAGVQPVTLHGARHSSVTAMRKAGVPDHMVAAWHGHDEVVMRRTYSHADADGLAAAGAALADVFSTEPATSVTNR
jgi:integrase